MAGFIFLHLAGVPKLLVALLCLLCGSSSAFNTVCYFTNWAQYRSGPAKYTVSNIDPSLCTHINFAFGKMNGNNIEPYESNDNQAWQQLNALKQINPNLKTLISIGGASLSPDQYPIMISSKENRAAFINSVTSFLRTWVFDGIDIDWEYPTSVHKQNFSLFAQEMRTAFQAEASSTNRARLLLSVCLPPGLATMDEGFDIAALNSSVDMFNVMSYDYHGSWDSTTNMATPLYDKGDNLSVNSTIKHCLSKGASPQKINLGLAFYGRSWTVSGSNLGIGAPASGPGSPGPYTKAPGILSYYEVCDCVQNHGCVPEYESSTGFVKYARNASFWVTYEDKESLLEKTKYIVDNNLGGAMIFTLDYDDFSGQFCGQGNASLTKLVSSRMLAAYENVTTTVAPTTSTISTTATSTTSSSTTSSTTSSITTSSTTTSSTTSSSTASSTTTSSTTTMSTTAATTISPVVSNNGSFQCPSESGIYPDSNCSFYNVCSNKTHRRIQCPDKTIFNPNSKYCENEKNTTYICPGQTLGIECPENWIYFGGSCYSYSSQKVTWEYAQAYCTVHQAKLAEIESAEEDQFMRSLAMANTASNVWIGGNDKCAEGYYVWASTGEKIVNYMNWGTDEPRDGPDGTADCIALWVGVDYKWDDDYCSSNNAFICEAPLTTTTAAPSTNTTSTTAAATTPSTESTNRYSLNVTTTTTSARTTSQAATTNGTFQCPAKNGFYPHENCSYFNICTNQVVRSIRCPTNTIFNPNTSRCENTATTTYTCPTQG